MSTLWPRLAASPAQMLLAELRALDPADLPRRAATSHRAQRFASTGGRRASTTDLDKVRSTIRATAEAHGYPDLAPDADRVQFDRCLAPALLDVMPMAAGEALNRSVWNFTSIVLAPDVTHWRMGYGNTERWVCSDRTRHMYARLWWQARQLTLDGPDGLDTSLLDQLSESELNQLLERTSIGGNKPLVTALARAIVALDPGRRRREVVRDTSLRLLRLTTVIDPYALHPHQLDQLVGQALNDTLAALRSAA